MTNNPLQQYFRRPSMYIALPSGGNYPAAVLEKTETNTYPVYPMTSNDEITTQTPDALYTGEAVAEIIRSCVPSIKNPWAITSVDLDSILVAIRIATNGTEMDMDSTCPKCDELNKFGLNLEQLLDGFKAGDYDKLLTLGDLTLKFRPLTYKESNEGNMTQFELQKHIQMLRRSTDDNEQVQLNSTIIKKINEITQNIICNSIEYILTPDKVKVSDKVFIKEYLVNCDKNAYAKIRDTNIKLRESTETKPLKFKCTACEHEYDQPFTLNVSDFFG